MKKILLLLVIIIIFSTPIGTNAIPIINTLGAATPNSQFSAAGSSGVSITPFHFVGPQFTLNQSTVLTEIGGFVNKGHPISIPTLPLSVQIRPDAGGGPDTSIILATFILSHNNNPLVYSYESVAINLLLDPGIYFALFAPQGFDVGGLLSSASSPFNYRAGIANMGSYSPPQGSSVAPLFGAVRVLGDVVTVTEPATLFLFGSGLLGFGLMRRKFRK